MPINIKTFHSSSEQQFDKSIRNIANTLPPNSSLYTETFAKFPKIPKIPTKTFRGFLMNTFFRQTAQAMIAKHIDRFPLLKLDQVIDWQPIEQYLNRQRTRYL